MQLRTKTQTSICRKICCVNSGFEILYAVEQFSSPFSKDKLKQGTHTHQTHDPPSRMSWENCRGVSTNTSHMCSVELALKGLALAGKGLLHTGFPKTRSAEFYPFGTIFPPLCIAATFEACVFPCGHRLLFVRGFGVLLLLGSLINLGTLGKWSSPLIRFATPSSGINLLVSIFSFFLSLLHTFSSLL